MPPGSPATSSGCSRRCGPATSSWRCVAPTPAARSAWPGPDECPRRPPDHRCTGVGAYPSGGGTAAAGSARAPVGDFPGASATASPVHQRLRPRPGRPDATAGATFCQRSGLIRRAPTTYRHTPGGPRPVELTPNAAAALNALADLNGEAGAGEVTAASGLSARTASRVLASLREAGLLEPAKGGKGRVRLTPSGWTARQQAAAAPVSAGAVVDAALDLWAGLGLYAHRAFLELLLSAVVGRHHIGTGRPDRHLAFVAVGESGTGKSALAQMACAVLGLDPVAHELYVPAQSPGSVIGRRVRGDGGYVWEPAPAAGRPVVLFDEFDKADEAVRKALMPYLDGRPVVQFEGEAVRLSPTPVLAANPPRTGDRLGHIRAEFRRRSVLLDTGYAAHRGDDVERALHDFYDQPRPHLDLQQLRLPPVVPPAVRELLGSLGQALTPTGRAAKPPLAALEAATLGRAALAEDVSEHGLNLAALSVCVAYLTVTEQLAGEVAGGWQLDFGAVRAHLDGHGGVDELERVVAGARTARSQAHARVARARVAGEAEDLELTGTKHQLGEQLRLAAEAIDGRRVPAAADKVTAKGLREQLRKARTEVLDCRSRGRLEDLRTIAAGPLQQAQELRRRIDREAAEQEEVRRQAKADQEQDRRITRQLEQGMRQQQRAQREAAKAQLDEVRAAAREGERLWNKRSVTDGQPPWRVLERLGLLRFEAITEVLERPDSWWRRLGTTLVDGVGTGRWVMTAGDPPVAFSGTPTSCRELAQWGEGTRAVLLPALAPLHAQEDQLVAALGLRPRKRPQLYRPQRPLPTVRVQSQRAPRALPRA
ncbi:MAG: hypothetical protein DI571_02330 [Arsenicicoccus sp.]|nr:MAG: hypothetical protein DI571_02330 [Arsenicicoccus sp.]